MNRLIVVALAALTVLGVGMAPAEASTQRWSTQRINVDPLGAHQHLKAGYTVVRTDHVTDPTACITNQGERVNNTDVCNVGKGEHTELSPCWSTLTATGSYHGDYCLTTPWTHNTVHVTLPPGELPFGSAEWCYTNRPCFTLWGIQLASGVRCQNGYESGGRYGVYDGKVVTWYCGHHNYLAGNPNKKNGQWTITEVTGRPFKDPTTVRIRTAWYGHGNPWR